MLFTNLPSEIRRHRVELEGDPQSLYQPPLFYQENMALTDSDKRIKILAQWMFAAKHLVVFTGAGVSTESGLPDFPHSQCYPLHIIYTSDEINRLGKYKWGV